MNSATIIDALHCRENLYRKYPFARQENIIFIIGGKVLRELMQSTEAKRILTTNSSDTILGSDVIISTDPDLLMAVIK